MELTDTALEIELSVRHKLEHMSTDIDDDTVLRIIEEHVFSNNKFSHINFSDKEWIIKRTLHTIRKDMGVLYPITCQEGISEIMVNGIDDVFIEKDGHLERADIRFASVQELEELIRRIAGKIQREFNEMNPILDARLSDGSRVNAIYKNVALNGPILTIRRFPEEPLTMEDLINNGTITRQAAEYLKVLVVNGYNCFISGGTSSGKTTLLNVLTEYIPADERIVVIEDSAELQINTLDNIVRLECRMANSQGRGGVTMADLIKASLRMRPTRIIVGEVRGGEAVDMVQAMNTGHDGSLSSGHGNSITGMLNRLEGMYQMGSDIPVSSIRNQISEAVDVIIHMGKMKGGMRRVLEIAEIVECTSNGFAINSLFVYGEDGLMPTGNTLVHQEKLKLRGVEL